MPAYLLPSIADARTRGRPHPLLTLAVAAWLRFLRGTDCAGRPLEVRDALVDELQPLALSGGTDPRPLLAQRSVFGTLAGDEAFAAAVEHDLLAMERHGVHAALEDRLGQTMAAAA